MPASIVFLYNQSSPSTERLHEPSRGWIHYQHGQFDLGRWRDGGREGWAKEGERGREKARWRWLTSGQLGQGALDLSALSQYVVYAVHTWRGLICVNTEVKGSGLVLFWGIKLSKVIYCATFS